MLFLPLLGTLFIPFLFVPAVFCGTAVYQSGGQVCQPGGECGRFWSHCPGQVLRNCVHPELGKHIFNCAFANKGIVDYTKQLTMIGNDIW